MNAKDAYATKLTMDLESVDLWVFLLISSWINIQAHRSDVYVKLNLRAKFCGGTYETT